MSKRLLCLLLTTLFILSGTVFYSFVQNNVYALSKQGSVGDEVTQIQQKLKELGYYEGDIDGIFGSRTKKAVIRFQQDNDLSPDGIVGKKTLKALELYKDSTPSSYTEAEIALLARFISAEARGEPYEGQVAVGAVILNRLEHPSFPNTIAGVLYQPGAFECLLNGQVNETVSDSSKKAAQDAMNGWDPSGGAIYYFNPKKTSNRFMHSRPVITVIGDHTFCS